MTNQVAQATMWSVVSPKWQSAFNRLRDERSRGSGAKLLLLSIMGLAFWAAVYGVLYRILSYFRGVEEIGPLLAAKLLGVALLAFLSILLLSNIITSLSTFFLARDLFLLMCAPVDWLKLYTAKLGETVVHSSWMVALMAVPIFAAYGVVYDAGPLYIPLILALFIPFLVIPAVIGSAFTLVLVNVFPARRTRDLLSIIAIAAGGVIILFFRLVQPERLAQPEGTQNLLDFLTLLRTPSSPLLPGEWVGGAVMSYLTGRLDALPIYLIWTTAAAAVVVGATLHSRLYEVGFTKAQEGADRFVRAGLWSTVLDRLLRWQSVSKREFVLKDIKLFFRDTTQWSQLILLGVLVVVYIFNIRALPLFRGEQVPFFYVSLVTFLNLGLAGFVLAAIAARFIFPSVSLEGRQMWLLRSSPLDLKTLLWSKYWTGTIPLLVLAVVLTLATNVILKVSVFMMAVSIGTIVMLTLSIAALALAYGTIYPQFDTENAAQIPTSFGGLLFMMTTIVLLALVIVAEAGPIYEYLRAEQLGTELRIGSQMIVSLGGVVIICLATTVVPLGIGLRRLRQFDF